MDRRAQRVGITGGIGAGKTFISKIFEKLGIDVYYADERAKWLQAHHPTLVHHIRKAFGSQAYDQAGRLNRAFLASKVFSDSSKLALLNQLVHPRVAEDYQRWTQQRATHPYTIKEAALLFETDAYQQLDIVINVNAPKAVRVKRVLRRDPQRSEEQLMRIMSQQLSDEERSRRADYTINNQDGVLILPQLVSIHQYLLNHTVAIQ